MALITGGGTGLGLAIGRALARRGARIAIASRGEEHLARGREALEAVEPPGGGRTPVWTGCCDVRDAHAVRRTIAAVEADCGPVAILVNNAAGNFIRRA